jgi:hypothetical protein
VDFTGTTMTTDQLTVHSRSEAALHRWDLVGDDDVSEQHLGQPELTRHAVHVLNAMPVLVESARIRLMPTGRHRIVLRSPDHPDVVVEAGRTAARFEVVEHGDGDVVLTTDPANRLLVIWGRRSSRRQLTIETDGLGFEALAPILWPNAVTWPR